MTSKLINIYAVRSDILGVLEAVEDKQPLTYFEMEISDKPPMPINGRLQLASLGTCQYGISVMEISYLCLVSGKAAVLRKIELRDGRTRIAIDQKLNHDSVVIRPGGVFDHAIIAGQVGTAYSTPASLALFGLFQTAIRKRFQKVKSYYVGPSALELLQKGSRLTPDVRLEPKMDLKDS